jgi:nucleoside-triphosphatase THEP1
MKNKIFIITGSRGSGKTTFLENLTLELKNQSVLTAGFKAKGFWQNNTRSHFEIVDLITEEKRLFCTVEQVSGWEKIGHYYLNPLAVDFGEEILEPNQSNQFSLFAIDEIGTFELQGKGWFNAIQKRIKSSPNIPMIWVVRSNLLQEVLEYFNIQNFEIIFSNKGKIAFWAKNILIAVNNQ